MLRTTDHAVLVAHEDVDMRCELAYALRDAGFQTIQASSGLKALKFAEYVSAAVIHARLVDVKGLEVCRLLRSRPQTAHIPLVHVSDHEHDHEGSKAVPDLVDACFHAPVDRSVLTATVVQLLNRNCS